MLLSGNSQACLMRFGIFVYYLVDSVGVQNEIIFHFMGPILKTGEQRLILCQHLSPNCFGRRAWQLSDLVPIQIGMLDNVALANNSIAKPYQNIRFLTDKSQNISLNNQYCIKPHFHFYC